MDKQRISYLYKQCELHKMYIKPILNEVMDYTSSFGSITDTITDGLISRSVDPAISDSVDSLQNFIMNTVFGVRDNWAKFEISKRLLINKYNPKVVESLMPVLQRDLAELTDVVFKFLFDTNYLTEITKSVRDCSNLGTGCYKIIRLNVATNPFTYQYIPLNNLFFMEDAFGNPNTVFRKYENQTADDVVRLFNNIEVPKMLALEDPSKTMNILECLIPTFDRKTSKTTFEHIVCTEDFQHVFKEESLDYSPYLVFRFSLIENSPWGKGAGIKSLDAMKRLRFYKSMRAKQVAKIVDPPVGFTGDVKLASQLSQKPGSFSYIGDTVTGRYADVKNIGVVGNLMEIDNDIATLKNEIRDIYMAKPFGDINEQEGAKSTVEIQRRYELFQERYSGTANLFYSELLKPTFYVPFKILEELNIIKLPEDAKEGVTLTFVNALTKNVASQEVQNIHEAKLILNETVPEYAPFIMKGAETGRDIVLKLNVPIDRVNSVDDIEKQKEQMDAQAQALAMQQLGSAKGQGVAGADNVAKEVTSG